MVLATEDSLPGALTMDPHSKAVFDLAITVGGMGAEISSLDLVVAVANHPSGRMSGNLSSVALADVYARRLQLGDKDGAIKRAFAAFSEKVPALRADVDRLYTAYHIPGGKAPEAPFKAVPLGGMQPPRDVQILTIAATFAHVWRAKQGAPGRPIGINFLRKIEHGLIFGLYGAVLAEVDWVVMGAGDPSAIPALLTKLARHEPVELPIHVATVPLGQYKVALNPRELVGGDLPAMRRPLFFAILSSHLQAQGLAANPATKPDGFVMEAPIAGGHNAPPQKKVKDERGYYIYGPEDEADIDAVAALGLPFWVAGGRGKPAKLETNDGPLRGRQIGTLFALSAESGMAPEIRKKVLTMIWQQKLEVVNDGAASPSSYPFKVALMPGTVADPAVYGERERICNIGHLRGWRPKNGVVIGACPADEEDRYTGSGGAAWRMKGAMCLCNGLLATCGLGQPGEAPLVTLGDIAPVRELQRHLRRMEYTAAEAASWLIGEL